MGCCRYNCFSAEIWFLWAVNDSREEFLDTIPDDVDLSLVPFLRTLSFIIAIAPSFYNRYRAYLPFHWLLRLLKTAQHGNCIEEISILIDPNRRPQDFTPSESDFFPWEEFGPLLTENFPRLRKIQISLQTDDFTSGALPLLWEATKPDDPWAKKFTVEGLLEIKEVSGEY